MTAARFHLRKVLTVLVTIALSFSIAFAAPAAPGSKSKKASAKSSKKSKVAKKSSSRKSKAVARSSRSSRSKARVAKSSRNSKRKGKVARGRRGKSRWRSQPATITSYGNGTGVHRYLTEVWTKGPNATDSTAGTVAGSTTVQPSTPSMNSNRMDTAPTDPRTGMKPTLELSPLDSSLVPITNPLVAAYAGSLEARGFRPDNQGFIITALNGEVLAEHNADKLFNPASVTKIATSLLAISRLGPNFKYRTTIYTDGALDTSTGVLHGSLYVIGSGDPAFFYENAIMIADKLNRAGIREVEGDLHVLGQFYFGFSTSREISARTFRLALNSETWNAAAKGAYPRYLSIRSAQERQRAEVALKAGEKYNSAPWPASPPSLNIKGKTLTDPTVDTSRLTQIAVHTSLPLVHILKGLNDFSNNWMAHVIGSMVGGPDAVERFLKTEVGFRDDEVSFATSSGLGANSISPRGTISLLRKLITYLNSKGLQPDDILPVAGVDAGTLQRRFTDFYRGSVVAKTGTLSGVSALAGVVYTREKGPLLFVIYNRGGSTHTFRAVQDDTLKKVISMFGGPAPVHLRPMQMPGISQKSDDATGQPVEAAPDNK